MSDELARKFDAAWAAVMGGVEWNPGDHDAIDGVTKDEAIEYAADFLKAYRDSNTGPVVEAARAVVSEYGDLPSPEGDDGSYPRLGEDTAVLENAIRDLARAVKGGRGTG